MHWTRPERCGWDREWLAGPAPPDKLLSLGFRVFCCFFLLLLLLKPSLARIAPRTRASQSTAATMCVPQFYWADYQYPQYVDAARHLADLAAEGKIRGVGLTK